MSGTQIQRPPSWLPSSPSLSPDSWITRSTPLGVGHRSGARTASCRVGQGVRNGVRVNRSVSKVAQPNSRVVTMGGAGFETPRLPRATTWPSRWCEVVSLVGRTGCHSMPSAYPYLVILFLCVLGLLGRRRRRSPAAQLRGAGLRRLHHRLRVTADLLQPDWEGRPPHLLHRCTGTGSVLEECLLGRCRALQGGCCVGLDPSLSPQPKVSA